MTDLRTFCALGALGVLAACGSQEQAADSVGNEHAHQGNEPVDEIEIGAAAAQAAGIVVSRAMRTSMDEVTELPAEVSFAADRIATIVPRVGGVVRSLEATEGDSVESGEILAILDSGRLANLVSAYRSALAAERFAQGAFERERGLLEKGVTSEAEFAAARQSAAMARAQREAAETALHAAGVDHDEIDAQINGPDGAAGRYRIVSPIKGRVINRSLSLGQSVQAGDEGGQAAFVVADDTMVWVDIQVFAKDLGKVREGQIVSIRNDSGEELASGDIAFVTPQLTEGSRTATARVVLGNEKKKLRPGQFLSATIVTGDSDEVLAVPTASLVTVEGQNVIFVPTDHGFAPRPVDVGRTFNTMIEVQGGLSEGDLFVSEGAFTLKAELEKDSFGGDHDH